MVCVEIEMNDKGEYSVGVCPPENENEPKEHLHPSKTLDAALAEARSLLQQQAQSPQDAVISEMGLGEAKQ